MANDVEHLCIYLLDILAFLFGNRPQVFCPLFNCLSHTPLSLTEVLSCVLEGGAVASLQAVSDATGISSVGLDLRDGTETASALWKCKENDQTWYVSIISSVTIRTLLYILKDKINNFQQIIFALLMTTPNTHNLTGKKSKCFSDVLKRNKI